MGRKISTGGWIAIGLVGFLLFMGLIIALMTWRNYNRIVTLQQNVEGQWANVESSYQRRADLIPNLVNTVKGYAEHEQETFTAVTEARSKATGINVNANELSPEAIARFQEAQSQLSGALSRLLLTVERYPELKANQNFLELQAQLEGTENRINVERNRFNDAVRLYNTKITTFPGVMYRGIFGFEKKGYFEANEGAQDAPAVSFD
jgi:LemA protein